MRAASIAVLLALLAAAPATAAPTALDVTLRDGRIRLGYSRSGFISGQTKVVAALGSIALHGSYDPALAGAIDVRDVRFGDIRDGASVYRIALDPRSVPSGRFDGHDLRLDLALTLTLAGGPTVGRAASCRSGCRSTRGLPAGARSIGDRAPCEPATTRSRSPSPLGSTAAAAPRRSGSRSRTSGARTTSSPIWRFAREL